MSPPHNIRNSFSTPCDIVLLKPALHCFDLLWICWTTSRTTSCTTSWRCGFVVDFRLLHGIILDLVVDLLCGLSFHLYSLTLHSKSATNRNKWSSGLTGDHGPYSFHGQHSARLIRLAFTNYFSTVRRAQPEKFLMIANERVAKLDAQDETVIRRWFVCDI